MIPGSLSLAKLFVTTQLLICSGVLAAVTLYAVDQPAPLATAVPSGFPLTISPVYSNSPTFSVGGVDSDGRTTYVEEGVLNAIVQVYPTETITFTSGLPATQTETFVAGASALVEEPRTETNTEIISAFGGPRVYQNNCTYEGTTKGVCVWRIIQMSPSTTETSDITWTNSLRPIVTLVENKGEGNRLNFGTNVIPTGFLGGLIMSFALFVLRIVF